MPSEESMERARALDVEAWIDATANFLLLAINGKITPGDLAAAKYTLREKLNPALDAVRLEEVQYLASVYRGKKYRVPGILTERLAELRERSK
jgi:hypothetical protein